MGKKKKTRIGILIGGFYLIGISFLCAYFYEQVKGTPYEIALWLSVAFHLLAIYVTIAHYYIEGED